MTMGDTSFKGKGETGPDGRVVFDLTDGQTQMRLNATLSPFAVELLPVRAPGTLLEPAESLAGPDSRCA